MRTQDAAVQIRSIGQRLLSAQAAVYNLFNSQRHGSTGRTLRIYRAQAMATGHTMAATA